MRKFILDCSATMAFFFQDETSPYVDAVFEALTQDARALVPPIWPLEVLNTCLAAERRQRLRSKEVEEIISILEAFPIEVVGYPDLPAVMRIYPLARRHHLSSYDAAYLELALREELPLVSLDKKLNAAAKKAAISLWSPVTK